MNLKALIANAALVLSCLSPALAQQQIPLTGGSASSSLNGPTAWAVDGNFSTLWNSGAFPAQWIELDMGSDRMVGNLNLVTGMYPNGPVNHEVLGRTAAGAWVSLANWNGWATDGQLLGVQVVQGTPVRYIIVNTTASPSWVAWREIQAFEKPQPRSAGDIVARDLAYPVGGVFGHLGMFDGENVMQVMSEPTVVQRVSYSNFASKSNPWLPVYTNIPSFSVRSCYLATCNFLDQYSSSDRSTKTSRLAMVARAYQIQLIGADYTVFASSASADPRMYDRIYGKYYPALRGVYRCDTFVGDIFAFTSTPNGQYFVPGSLSYLRIERVTSNVPSSWNTNVGSLFYTPVVPSTLYDRFKAF